VRTTIVALAVATHAATEGTRREVSFMCPPLVSDRLPRAGGDGEGAVRDRHRLVKPG